MHTALYLRFGVCFFVVCLLLFCFVGLVVVVFLPPSTSSGLDRLVKEIEERVTRLDNCISFLVDRFKAVCYDYQSIFIF